MEDLVSTGLVQPVGLALLLCDDDSDEDSGEDEHGDAIENYDPFNQPQPWRNKELMGR